MVSLRGAFEVLILAATKQSYFEKIASQKTLAMTLIATTNVHKTKFILEITITGYK